MGSPTVHAELSAKRFGGNPKDYLHIHELMDSSKQAFSDMRHRTLTHNSWFVTTILEKIFGSSIKNSDGKTISVRDIGQWHVMEDFHGSFPTVQDYLENMKFKDWMDNGKGGDAIPPSHVGLPKFNQKLLEPKPLPKEVKRTHSSFPTGGFNRGCGGGGRLD